MPTICTAKASYKKLPGLLELTDSYIQWTQDGKKAPSVRVKYAECNSLFCSKEGAPQVRLKISLIGNDTGHNFTFTSPQPTATQERERFKQEITAFIARRRALETATPTASTPAATPGGPITSLPHTPANGGPVATPKPYAPGLSLPHSSALGSAGRTHSRAASTVSVSSGDRRGTPTITGSAADAELDLCKRVLMNDPELQALHGELVISSGLITEAEFWDGREHLILAQAVADRQRKGKSGQLIDPRPEIVDGEERIRVTIPLKRDIFDEYPIVQKAFNENVPHKLTEPEFWHRYFKSKLFNAHRASIRSSAKQFVVNDDDIFDKYLEKDDDGLEPRRERTEKADAFLNLAATNEDHGESTVERDVTMQSGRQKGVLPLIRKFNMHSERLLSMALGDLPPNKRRRVDTPADTEGEAAYDAIEIDDLREGERSKGILLEMQDRQRYFEGSGPKEGGGAKDMNYMDVRALAADARHSLEGWEKTLGGLKIERVAGDSALRAMTQNVASRLDVRSKKNDLPIGIFQQMTACQSATNEFLRQFWSSTLPLTPELEKITTASKAERTAKAQKMIGYLERTPGKVRAIGELARAHGVEGGRVEGAMKSLLDAVGRAVEYQRGKEAAGAASAAKRGAGR